MKRTLIAASLVVFLSTNLLGSQANAVTVRGVPYCADWAKARSEEGWIATAYQLSVIGMLNGLAVGMDKDFWKARGRLTNDQVFFWMDRYCDNNPLKDVADGTLELWYERFPE